MSDIFLHFSIATNVAILLMTFTWLLAIRLDFFSSVDVAWAYGFSVVGIFLAIWGPGWNSRKWIFLLMIASWSFRLGTYLTVRLKNHFPKEDGRYTVLRSNWKKNPHRAFFIFFMAQGLSIALLSAPMVFVAANSEARISNLEWMGFALWCLALIGETTADSQLENFKKDSANAGKTCNTGLWKLSRHPNYFFEFLIWCSFALFASGSPGGWISWYCPVAILVLLFKVTGIPTTEAQSLKSRGEEYRRYQETTSAFVPWFPKKTT